MAFKIVVEGLTQLQDDARRAGANIKPLINLVISKSLGLAQANIRRQAPHRTGNLQRSVMISSIVDMSGSVLVQERYGAYVEYGTKPHLILPKNKKALFWKGALNPYAVVHHPGTRANPFFMRGVDQSIPSIQLEFTNALEQITRQLAGN